MKFLIPCTDDRFTLAWSYARALSALGHEVTTMDPTSRLERSRFWTSRVLRRLFEHQILRYIGPDILSDMLALGTFDAVFVPKGAWALPSFWQTYKAERPKTLLVCYNADDPITSWSRGANRPWLTDAIPCFDLYVTYNQALVEPIRERASGAVLCLPFAWDPEIHPPHPFVDSADVVFVGNADAYREKWLTKLLEDPIARDWRIKVYGNWGKVKSTKLKQVIQTAQVGADMSRVVGGARVSLNILREQNIGSHNMRTFETPGSGGVLASQYSAEQNAVFPNDEAAIYFNSPEDVASKLEPYIADPNLLANLRKSSQARVQHETYLNRAGRLVTSIEGLLT